MKTCNRCGSIDLRIGSLSNSGEGMLGLALGITWWEKLSLFPMPLDAELCLKCGNTMLCLDNSYLERIKAKQQQSK